MSTETFKFICKCLMVIIICGIFAFACVESVRNDEKRRAEIAALPEQREFVGEVATGVYSTIRLYEFEHPKRPGMTCLWAQESSYHGGLHCWRNE